MLNKHWRRFLEADTLEFIQRVISTHRWHEFWQTYFQCPNCLTVVSHKNAVRHHRRCKKTPKYHAILNQVCKLCARLHYMQWHVCELQVVESCSQKSDPHLQLYCNTACLKRFEESVELDVELPEVINTEKQGDHFWLGVGCAVAVLALVCILNK
jgi:hypothetical protein